MLSHIVIVFFYAHWNVHIRLRWSLSAFSSFCCRLSFSCTLPRVYSFGGRASFLCFDLFGQKRKPGWKATTYFLYKIAICTSFCINRWKLNYSNDNLLYMSCRSGKLLREKNLCIEKYMCMHVPHKINTRQSILIKDPNSNNNWSYWTSIYCWLRVILVAWSTYLLLGFL